MFKRKKGTISLLGYVKERMQNEGIPINPLDTKEEMARKILFSPNAFETYPEQNVLDRRHLFFHPAGGLNSREVRNLLLVFVGWGKSTKKPLAALKLARKIVKKKLREGGFSLDPGKTRDHHLAPSAILMKGSHFTSAWLPHEIVIAFAKEGVEEVFD